MARSHGAHRKSIKKASGFATFVAAAAVVGAVASASPAQATLIEYGIPGTGSTVPNPPAGTPSNPWVEGGIWDQIPNRKALLDSDDYPALLGRGTKVTLSDGTVLNITGQMSIDMGAAALLRDMNQDWAADPDTVHVIYAGSQGTMVFVTAMNKAAADGRDLSNVYAILYSFPYTKGTGFIDRFGPNEDAFFTGINGGAPSIPNGPSVGIVNRQYDPMAHMPRFIWTFLVTIPNAVLGFVFEHGDLGKIDWQDPENTVTKDGNVTTYTLHSKVVPLLKPIALVGALMGIPINRMYDMLRPLDDIVRPIVDMGGQDDPGRFQLMPSPEVLIRQLAAVANGPVKAVQDLIKLILHQPLSVPNTSATSPSQGMIDQAEQKEEELTGGLTSPGSNASVNALVADSSVATPQPQAEPEAPQQPAASAQPEQSVEHEAARSQVQSPVQEQPKEPVATEETPQQPTPQPVSDPSDTTKDGDTSKEDQPSAHTDRQDDKDDKDGDKKSADENGLVSQPRSQSRPSATTPHSKTDDSDDDSSESKQTPKPKVQSHQQQTPKRSVEHDNQSNTSSANSGSSSNEGSDS